MHAFKSFMEFDKGLVELVEKVPSAHAILTYGQESKLLPETSEEAVKSILSYMSDHIPSIFDENFPDSEAISIKNTEIGFKTLGKLAWGWRVEVTEDGDISYNMRITINSKDEFARNSKIMKAAEEAGWLLKNSNFNRRNNYSNRGNYNRDKDEEN